MESHFCILGCGKQGRVIGNRLLKLGYNVRCIDNDEKHLTAFKGFSKKADVRDIASVAGILSKCSIAINALPASLGLYGIKSSIAAKKDMVDITFIAEDVFLLDESAKKAGVLIIPDCGVAPGLSNICAGNAFTRLGNLQSLGIYVGGIPQKEAPPLNLCVTFNPYDLLSEYKRPVRIVENGELKTVQPLSSIEEITFQDRVFECFYTDGLRTLIKTIKSENMFEKTIRYRGHAAWLKQQSEDELLRILKEYSKKEIEDIMLFRVVAKNNTKRITYEMIDTYTEGITAMSRTTGYTALVMAELLLNGKVTGTGIIPPELIGMNERLYDDMVNGLKRFNIQLSVKNG